MAAGTWASNMCGQLEMASEINMSLVYVRMARPPVMVLE